MTAGNLDGKIGKGSKWLKTISRFVIVAGICVLGYFLSFFLFPYPISKIAHLLMEYLELATGIISGFWSIIAGILLVVTFFSLAISFLKAGKFTSIIKKP